jgi:hypothetical protein
MSGVGVAFNLLRHVLDGRRVYEDGLSNVLV